MLETQFLSMEKPADLNLLRGNLLQSLRKLEIRDKFKFYQDDDAKHHKLRKRG